MSVSDVASRIVSALALSDPELDTSIGTPLRKIIDAFAQQIDQTTTDPYLLDYQYDIDTKSGGALDDFVANFGLARLQGQRATGLVTFSRNSTIAALTAVTLPPGIQVVSLDNPPIYVQTTIAANLALNQLSVDIPVVAVVAGPSGNVLSGSLNSIASSVNGITQVTNSNPLSGGTLDETDDQLRARFRSTVFRNLTGTDAMYRGIALQTLADPTDASSNAVTQVNILGSTKHQVEQIQVVGGTAISSLTTSAYNIANSTFVGPSISTGSILNLNSDYTVTVNNTPTGSNPATLTITSVGSNMPDGVYDLEYDYVPQESRNDLLGSRWNQGIVNNRVDVYVNGIRNATATQSVHFLTSLTFNTTTNDPFNLNRFVTLNGSHPVTGDIYVPLGFGPITSVPNTLSINNGIIYTEGVDYDIVHQDDAFGYTPNSQFGLVFHHSAAHYAANPIPNSTSFSITYTYNNVPRLVANNLANWRMLGTDAQIHAGKPAYLQLNFAVVYDQGATPSAVNTSIDAALSNYLQGLGFSAAVQVSDLIEQAHNVPGVDNIRFTSNVDNSVTYGIQLLAPDGVTVLSNFQVSGRATDVYFDERTYPILANINFNTKARNTFRT